MSTLNHIQYEASKHTIVGLPNMGNTCFMNSGLQVLLHMDHLMELFVQKNNKIMFLLEMQKSINHTMSNCKENETKNDILVKYKKKSEIIFIWLKFIKEYFNNGTSNLSDLIHKIWEYPLFQIYDQGDAFEYLQILLELFNELTTYGISDSKNLTLVNHVNKKEFSYIKHMFSLFLEHTFVCTCGHTIHKNVHQFITQLHLDKNHTTLIDMLKHMFNEEKLDDYKCDKCSEKNVTKYVSVQESPVYWILQLCRFNMMGRKNHKSIRIPTKVCINKVKYRLHSLILHQGSLNNGHYVSILYQKNDNKFYMANDDDIDDYTENMKPMLNSNLIYGVVYERIFEVQQSLLV